MFIMRNKETGDVMGPYQTKKLAIQYGPKGEQWEPKSIGKRTAEQAQALGAAINSAKVSR